MFAHVGLQSRCLRSQQISISGILRIFQNSWNIFRFSENISEFLKYFQNFWNIFRISEIFSGILKYFQIFSEINPKSVEDFSVTSEVDSELLTTLRKNIFKRSSCKFLWPWPVSCAKTTKCQFQKISEFWKILRKSEKFSEFLNFFQKIWKLVLTFSSSSAPSDGLRRSCFLPAAYTRFLAASLQLQRLRCSPLRLALCHVQLSPTENLRTYPLFHS